jgi:threonine/homoserine/homoserine lactone efflux protein
VEDSQPLPRCRGVACKPIMRPGAVATFLTIDVVLVLTPGPDWAYVIAVGLRDRIVVPAVAGIVAGYAALTVLVAGGLAVLIVASPGALTAMTLVGAAYLIWLGVSVLSRLSDPGSPARAPRAAGVSGVVARGAATSGLNPKALLLFVAVLPQFVTRRGGLPLAAQIGVLGAIHTVICAVVYLALGTLARNALVGRPTAARAVARASGVAMIGLGVLLLVERTLASA